MSLAGLQIQHAWSAFKHGVHEFPFHPEFDLSSFEVLGKLCCPQHVLTQLKAHNGKGSANLEVNGVVKPVTINYSLKDGLIKATFNIKASDFNLSKAQYLGVGVEDVVTVNVEMAVK